VGLLDSLRDIEEPLVRDRPIGIILIALGSLVAGVVILLAAGELFLGAARFGDWTQPKIVGNDYVGAVQVYPEHYLLIGGILVIPGLILLALAIGLVRQRWWAGITGLMLGALMALYGVLALVIPTDAASGADRWHPAAGLPWLILGLALAWYFNRRVIRADLGMGDRTFG
jgi:cell division protein FtsW (lipid II flippase)